MSDLPSGWTQTTLGEIAETSLGKMLDRGKSQGDHLVPYLRNSNVQWGHIDLDDVLTMDIPPEEREFFGLRPDDLLVCEGGEIGRCAIWLGGSGYMAFQKALHRVRPHESIAAKFVLYLLEHLSATGVLLGFATGSTIKHLPQERLRRLPVNLPPLAEQQRIVATLDDHLSRLDAARYELNKTASRSARLHADIREALLNPWTTKVTELGLILREPLANGRSVQTNPHGFPVLRLTALRDGYLDLDERKGGEWTFDEARPFLVRKNDFFISRGNGSLSRVGRGGLLAIEPDPIAFPDTLIRARVNELHVLPDFLRLIWDSRGIRRQIESAARTTAGIYKINQQIIEQVRIPIPPLQDQECIVEEFDAISSKILHARGAAESSAARAGKLRTSLLAEAFSGRLVMQDPGDESASVLLDRIRAKQVAQPRAGRGRSRAKISRQKEMLL
jgi:type I restriction enzyme, S subunit